MIGAEVTYHPFFRLRVMKYWSSIWLTDGRLPEPATDQTLLTRLTIVHLPGCASSTTLGPMLNLPCPRTSLVAVGIVNTGPIPQISFPCLRGERKNVGFMSPSPYSPPVFWFEKGC